MGIYSPNGINSYDFSPRPATVQKRIFSLLPALSTVTAGGTCNGLPISTVTPVAKTVVFYWFFVNPAE